MNETNKMGYAVYHQDFGTAFFQNEKIAYDLYEKLDDKKELFKVLENGNMILIK